MGAWWADRSDVFDADDYNQESCVLMCTGILATTALAIVGTLLLLLVLRATIGLRVDPDGEREGLDLNQHGEEGYIFL